MRVLVGVANQKADGTACRLSLKYATQQFYLVWLVSGCRDVALSWPAAIQLMLYEIHVDVDACRHSVDYASHRLAVALAERGQPEYISEGVHSFFLI
jgi:hypothetical protein